MYKLKIFFLAVFLLFFLKGQTQNVPTNSQQAISENFTDTSKIKFLLEQGNSIFLKEPDSSIVIYKKALAIATYNQLHAYEAKSLLRIGCSYSINAKQKDSVKTYFEKSWKLVKQYGLEEVEVEWYVVYGQIYAYSWRLVDSAVLLTRQGITSCAKYEMLSRQADLYLVLSSIYSFFNKTDEAFEACLDGIGFCDKNKLPGSGKKIQDNLRYIFNAMPADSAIRFAQKGIMWAQEIHQKKWEADFWKIIGGRNQKNSNYPQALKAYMEALIIYEGLNDRQELANIHSEMGRIYMGQGEYHEAISALSNGAVIQEKIGDLMLMYNYEQIGGNYAKLKMRDSAIYYAKKSYHVADSIGKGHIIGSVLNDLGELYAELGEDSIAMVYFRQSLPDILSDPNDFINRAVVYTGMAKMFEKNGQRDSSVYFARLALPAAKIEGLLSYVIDASTIASNYFREKNIIDSAFFYQSIAMEAKDSLYSQEKVKEIQKIGFNEQIRQQKIQQEKIAYQNKIRLYVLLGGMLSVLLIAGILYRNNRHKQKANNLLSEQKQKIESTLSELKSAQSQLIQSEKMASLGELTAGIAHEIQNPLNFVNNFSEVSNELLAEMKTALDNGDIDEAKAIAEDVKQNLEKINHHGKRADAIVKGMLQHSRSSSGQKEPTDINALCDEYLRLSYHGLRAKDPSFNATLKTEFDNSLSKVNIVSQDIGRVILNLLTNAFYAVNEKKKSGVENYEPTITIGTGKINGKVEIKVEDNGNGIPDKVFEKIFQPFFTTKPTGQGTGLGLSLSYDIITKGHGGELKVETKENVGTTFIIILPV